jgi:hypothetical protein
MWRGELRILNPNFGIKKLKDSSSLNYSQEHHDNCDNEQDVDYPASVESYESYQPSDYQNDRNDIKQISHD